MINIYLDSATGACFLFSGFSGQKQFTNVLQGSPYLKAFDKVMWRCVQAGLIDKWLKDLNSFYLKKRLEKRSLEKQRMNKEKAEIRKDDGMVSQEVKFTNLTF